MYEALCCIQKKKNNIAYYTLAPKSFGTTSAFYSSSCKQYY